MAVASPPTTTAPKHFGRFELKQMLGRSQASGAWLAVDPRLQQEVILLVPRAQPASKLARQAWAQQVQVGGRLKHPRLAEVVEIGEHDGWPFLTCMRGRYTTLSERVGSGTPPTPVECATWISKVLEGLAYAHEAGVAHEDIGLHNVLVDQNGQAMLLGLGAGLRQSEATEWIVPTEDRQQVRQAAERDVLMVGLLLYRLLANHAALDDADLGRAASRIGAEIVRLPWTTPHPVSETLRAIVNRATDRQHRQRYLNARTLLSALQGWIKTNSQESGGPLLLLLDRLNSVGALPGRANTERALLASLSEEALRVDDFVDVVVKNPTLVWELLRSVNVASFQSRGVDEGVTTLSRAIMLLGQQGIRRVAAGVRPWPGALDAQNSLQQESGAIFIDALNVELRRACLAGHIARLMAPFSIHDEEASVAAMSQRLGLLLILYHFPDEAGQIRRLMLPGQPAEPGGAPTPGMSLDAASSAVLGINLDDLTVAVMKHWGFHDRLTQAARPLSKTATVRVPVTVDDTLRTVASLANELVNAAALEPAKSVAAIHQAFLRYARPLGLTSRECTQTIEHATRLVDRVKKPNEVVTPA
jgi:HD-like signal output (HDOD) protein